MTPEERGEEVYRPTGKGGFRDTPFGQGFMSSFGDGFEKLIAKILEMFGIDTGGKQQESGGGTDQQGGQPPAPEQQTNSLQAAMSHPDLAGATRSFASSVARPGEAQARQMAQEQYELLIHSSDPHMQKAGQAWGALMALHDNKTLSPDERGEQAKALLQTYSSEMRLASPGEFQKMSDLNEKHLEYISAHTGEMNLSPQVNANLQAVKKLRSDIENLTGSSR
jgi:hypothetical protein